MSEKEKNINGEKDIISDIESKLDVYLNKKKDHLGDLESKLDDFLTDDTPFGIDALPDTPENDKNKENQNSEKPELTKEEKLSKIDEDLEALKKLVKKDSNKDIKTEKEQNDPLNYEDIKKRDEKAEKKFKEKELEDALKALKERCSLSKKTPEEKKEENNPPEDVSDDDFSKSLDELRFKIDTQN